MIDTPNWQELKSVPNLVSLSRMLLIPFLVVLIVQNRWGSAALLAALLGISDFIDGWIARRFNQVTKLGSLLDPLIDRVFVISVLLAMVISNVISIWILVGIIGRDITVLLVNFFRGANLDVTVVYLGKLGTWILFVAFAMIFAARTLEIDQLSLFASAGIYWGLIVYWLAGVQYVKLGVRH